LARLAKQCKECEAKAEALEEERDAECAARSRAERGRSDVHRELSELNDRLDEERGVTARQIEIGKRQEAEIAKLRRELDEMKVREYSQLNALNKKNTDGIAELNDQIAEMKRQKAKIDKEKASLTSQVEMAMSHCDAQTKLRADVERRRKELEVTLADLGQHFDEQSAKLQDSTAIRNRTSSTNDELKSRIEELQAEIDAITGLKTQITHQLDETRQLVAEENSEKKRLDTLVKSLRIESEHTNASLQDEIAARDELEAQLNRALAEVQQLKGRFESADLLDENVIEKQKMMTCSAIKEIEMKLDTSNAKITTLQKEKDRLSEEVNDINNEVERLSSYIGQLNKKEKSFNETIGEWKKRVDDASNELDSAQRECRLCTSDLFKERTVNDNLTMQMEGLKYENANLDKQLKELRVQFENGGKSINEKQKMMKSFELEKEELQRLVDETEAAAESEQNKVSRFQTEIKEIRANISKKLKEKEEEFENVRKNYQISMESIQVECVLGSLEAEKNEKSELQRLKKKLEADVNDLETALTHANSANEDTQTNLRKYAQQISELQHVLEDEQIRRQQFSEDCVNAEKRLAFVQSEKEVLELKSSQVPFDSQLRTNEERLSTTYIPTRCSSVEFQAERLNNQLALETNEVHQQIDKLTIQCNDINAANRRMQEDIADLDEASNELKNSEKLFKANALEASNASEQLRMEQARSEMIERERKSLEMSVKDVQCKLDEQDAAMLTVAKNEVNKMEDRLKTLNADGENARRRTQDAMKTITKQQRQIRQLEFEIDENLKRNTQMNELIEKLQNKLKQQKKQIDDAEELATLNLQKYRQIYTQVQNAEERAEAAENSVQKIRSKTKLRNSGRTGNVSPHQ
uniref:Myosin_tail_1 domain-containing protein n=1 Tax=Anisakis simplex TaxID=6269 RepID=A0A0M3J052_ANISI